ncbi:MAG: hypothetical protein A2030_07875 [Chloroflexi bacterium RBG_19FT_COMBO_50_10]|nr:MAG: hypothetical protein A2030_07875 [Chloroflexi bacterium RBG_19FT_COMBO_50_10]
MRVCILICKSLRNTMTVILIGLLTASSVLSHAQAAPAFSAPVLKWQLGGCYSSWCETGWYSSPATADLDGDGQVEVIASAYSIFVLDGKTGTLEWKLSSGHDRSESNAPNVGRTWPGIVIADIDDDGAVEIVTAHSGGWVSVYTAEGYFKPGWPQHPTSSELRGLLVNDLDGDNMLEVIVTGAVGSRTNTWIFEFDGTLRPGWPQLSNDSGYAYGVFNANASAGNLDSDGANEIVVPSDVHYICAYEANGTQIPANPIYGGKGWGKVGVWESLTPELRGWGECNGVRMESYRTNFAHGPSVIADMNRDGSMEVVVTGNTYDCSADPYASKYNGVYVFNADRSRFNVDGFDWRIVPVDTGPPLTENYGVIENDQPNPAVADLDGDGRMEIIYASYDGRVHAFWLDKSEHGNWPYSVYQPAEGFFRFASEPVIADLDDNGFGEVIFTSWTQKGSYHTGKLHILDYLGNPIYEVSLPNAFGGADWNGALPAPTLANIDSDLDLEIVLLTANSGVVAYDLPGTSNASMLWGTGRGDYQRDGNLSNAIQPTLRESTKVSSRVNPNPGESLTFTISLHNPGGTISDASMTDPIPAKLDFAGNLWASSGTASYSNGVVSWNGAVSASVDAVIRFDVTIDEGIISPEVIYNTATITDGAGRNWQRQSFIYVLAKPYFLPLVRH